MNDELNGRLMDFMPLDETEAIHIDVDDNFLENSEIGIKAYNFPESGYTLEENPEKAVVITIDHFGIQIEIFLDTVSQEWQSSVCGQMSLSPQQMERFFKTNFFQNAIQKIESNWPKNSKIFSNLSNSLHHKRICVSPYGSEYVQEDSQFRKYNIDKEKSKEKNAAGQQIRTNSGRLIVTFSDFGVCKKELARYYCWPKVDKEFKYSNWNLADKVWSPKKSSPMFVRMSFWHNEYEYGLNLGLRDEIDENRGFFAYNLTLQPPVQWTTPIETNQMMTLSIVQRFLSICKKRILYFLNLDTDEIYDKINNPEKITKDQIENTKIIIRKNFDIIRNPRADTYVYD